MQAKQTRSDILYMTTLDTGRCSQYVYMVPPQRSMFFNLLSTLPTSNHLHMTIFSTLPIHKHVHMIIHAHTQAYTVRLSKHIHTRSTSVCRLKPTKPIAISIGARIQDPRLLRESWILDLGSWSRLKFQSVQSVSIGIQESANRPLDNLGSWILDPIPD